MSPADGTRESEFWGQMTIHLRFTSLNILFIKISEELVNATRVFDFLISFPPFHAPHPTSFACLKILRVPTRCTVTLLLMCEY